MRDPPVRMREKCLCSNSTHSALQIRQSAHLIVIRLRRRNRQPVAYLLVSGTRLRVLPSPGLPEPSAARFGNFGCTLGGTMGKGREPQIILKTDRTQPRPRTWREGEIRRQVKQLG